MTPFYQGKFQRYERIEFRRIDGDLREFEGSWLLERADEGQKTLVVYSVYLDPGFFVPQWLVRFLLRRELPDLIFALRNRVLGVSGQ